MQCIFLGLFPEVVFTDIYKLFKRLPPKGTPNEFRLLLLASRLIPLGLRLCIRSPFPPTQLFLLGLRGEGEWFHKHPLDRKLFSISILHLVFTSSIFVAVSIIHVGIICVFEKFNLIDCEFDVT